MTAGLIMSRVKPETGAHRCQTQNQWREGRALLTIFRIVVDSVYPTRITDRLWRKTFGGDDFGPKLGARWTRLCGIKHTGIWTIWFWETESEIVGSVCGGIKGLDIWAAK